MSILEILLLVAAGFAAGGMNALAGGGTFFSFPALLAIGLPPVTANATNAVALWPASLAGAWAARASLRPLGRYLLPLLLAGLAGGLLGGLLLLAGGDDVFSLLIPWLLLAATALFAASPRLSRWLAARRKESAVPPHSPLSLGAHSLVSIYGGYFGAGMGILQLAAFSIEGHALVRANALKNLISAVIYSVASLTFIFAGRVSWFELLILLGGATLGGYAGGALSQKLPASWLRALVILVGSGMTLYYFWAIYLA
ncbi:sulfite exporter TauE/SafE family protein [Pseudomonas phenolilytica]|uniref:sulfite exporter TauE/SafE family protein n=1 Tax=Pseudomonas phenolilytica TaxID=2746321 RepID=UPI001F3B3530|nr:sulfite exporter TauE/SafE family protein [Pseudomonas phenolilytica]UIP85439.1 sulfite exporter TauE/SafE family protein [Pseudomonas phenolilytica]